MAWQPTKYLWQWQLKSSIEDLWPYVADTERFNQATKLPSIDFKEEPVETGGSRKLAQTSKFGIVVKYEDHPFEWIQEQRFTNVREFEQGPVTRTYAELTLEPNEAGTMLNYYVEVTPANLIGYLGIPYQFGWEMRRSFEKVFRQIDTALQKRVDQPFDLQKTGFHRLATTRLADLTRKLAEEGHQLRWVQKLGDLLLSEADLNLTRIRPYVLADQWQASRRDILEMFLSAAKLSILNMRWDLMCPLCRGAKFTSESLDGVVKGVHCPSCNIDFDANFSENVELTFIPHPQIRSISDNSYCIGGPMVTPHILMHQILEAGETRTISAKNLLAGGYRVRTQQPSVEQWLDLSEADEQSVAGFAIRANENAIDVTMNMSDGASSDELEIVLSNDAPYRQRIYLERSDWFTNAVTAAYVTSLQHFRELFSDEVLRPGEEIGIQGMTILFSDLVGSTAMYNKWGDAPSYALVRKQFSFLGRIVRENEGAIVKTIGDAIMATFSEPASAVQAALAIQKEVAAFNATNEEPLIIRLGLHHGPCIAVNLNGRLDYFGTTVNLAARLEGQSRGNDIVISDALRLDPAVSQMLAYEAVQVDKFETSIKGFDENFALHRLTLVEV